MSLEWKRDTLVERRGPDVFEVFNERLDGRLEHWKLCGRACLPTILTNLGYDTGTIDRLLLNLPSRPHDSARLSFALPARDGN